MIVRLADKTVVWKAGAGQSAPGRVVLQEDGNFVVYDAKGQPRWASGTDRESATELRLTGEGELRLLGTRHISPRRLAHPLASPSRLSSRIHVVTGGVSALRAYLVRGPEGAKP